MTRVPINSGNDSLKVRTSIRSLLVLISLCDLSGRKQNV